MFIKMLKKIKSKINSKNSQKLKTHYKQEIEDYIEQEVERRLKLISKDSKQLIKRTISEDFNVQKEIDFEKVVIPRIEKEREEQKEQERLAKLEKEREEQKEQEHLAKIERAREEQKEQERLAKLERAREEQKEQERLAKLEKEREEQKEQERLAKLERAREEQKEQERLAKLEKEREEQKEQERLAKLEKEREEQKEQERLAKIKRAREEQLEQERVTKLNESAKYYGLKLVNNITPLMRAAEKNQIGEVKRMLEMGENPNECNQFLETPLILALKSIQRGSFHEVVKLLLSHGANPHVKTTIGLTAYMYALSRKDSKSLSLLESFKVNTKEYKPLLKKGENKKNAPFIKNKNIENLKLSLNSVEGNSKTNYPDFSRESEIQYLSHIRNKILSSILSARERMKSNDFGGADAYTNSILRGYFYRSIKQLEEQYVTPYFGRIVFKKSNKKSVTYYIGKYGLIETNIIAWTAPAASMFYQKKLGSVKHPSLGRVHVELIRQLPNLDGNLGEIHDLRLTASGYYDPILEQKLGGTSNYKLGDIVETIQAEQDKIIRRHKSEPIIVQGSAGSGKTTVALHRIPYLLQTNNHLVAERILFLGPNNLFLNYINEVLPGIGVGNIEQNTFEGWVRERINPQKEGYTITDYFENYNILLKLSEEQQQYFINKNQLKGTLTFKKAIKSYVHNYIDSCLKGEDFEIKLDEFLFKIDGQEIKKWYYSNYKSYSYYKRKNKILSKIKEEFERICGETENKDDIFKIFSLALHDYEKDNFTSKNIYEIYFDFITSFDNMQKAFGSLLDLKTIEFIVKYSVAMKNDCEIEHEDLAPLMFIFSMLNDNYGIPTILPSSNNRKKSDKKFSNRLYQYIVVDEAQDYNQFQINMLKNLVEKGSLMLVGDLGQSIHAYRGITNWRDIQQVLKSDIQREVHYVELSTSYRSTKEIISLSNSIIYPISNNNSGNNSEPLFGLSQPVGRSGKKPTIITCSHNEMYSQVINIVKDLQEKGLHNIAIIVSKRSEVMEMYNKIESDFEFVDAFINSDKNYEGGIIIIPAYLSKGLEFDASIVFNISLSNYNNSDLDRKLLYVASTRALHELYFLSNTSDKSPIIKDLDNRLFDSREV